MVHKEAAFHAVFLCIYGFIQWKKSGPELLLRAALPEAFRGYSPEGGLPYLPVPPVRERSDDHRSPFPAAHFLQQPLPAYLAEGIASPQNRKFMIERTLFCKFRKEKAMTKKILTKHILMALAMAVMVPAGQAWAADPEYTIEGDTITITTSKTVSAPPQDDSEAGKIYEDSEGVKHRLDEFQNVIINFNPSDGGDLRALAYIVPVMGWKIVILQ